MHSICSQDQDSLCLGYHFSWLPQPPNLIDVIYMHLVSFHSGRAPLYFVTCVTFMPEFELAHL